MQIDDPSPFSERIGQKSAMDTSELRVRNSLKREEIQRKGGWVVYRNSYRMRGELYVFIRFFAFVRASFLLLRV